MHGSKYISVHVLGYILGTSQNIILCGAGFIVCSMDSTESIGNY